MRALASFALGLLLGPLSWAAAYAVSGTFEPFDNASGFFACQAVLALGLFAVALRVGVLRALACLVGAWIGMNAYAWLAGSSEMRAWIVLLLFSSLTLLLLPLAAAILGGIARALLARRSAARASTGR
ncbi:MAG: hypothetical protein ACOY82_00270 [Pseudomonadota bacterium]